MKKIFALAFMVGSAYGHVLSMCEGDYALCAASAVTPTGKTITVNGTAFKEGRAICPVLTGQAIANLALMNGSCKAPRGKVWSLFSPVKSYPQAPSWDVAPAVFRSFVTTDKPGGGMSNMWSFSCDLQPQPVNGVQLANCFGPMNESPWNDTAVPPGTVSFTQAPAGAANPVGGNVP